MARRKKEQLSDAKLLIGILATLSGIGIVLANPRSALVVLFLAAGVIVILRLFRDAQKRAVHNSLYVKADAVIRKQIDPLTRKRAQLVRQDDYGKWQLDKWEREVEGFIIQHIAPVMAKGERALLQHEHQQIARMLNERVESAARNKPALQAFSDRMTPSEFEYFCAEQLRLAGWNARVTMQSRDQGVDVVAEKAAVRVVLQCKLYSGSVGNKAVQEVAAGRAHEQAHHGAVVTNSRYTSGAEQLASTNGILLLHYRDLTNLEALCHHLQRSR